MFHFFIIVHRQIDVNLHVTFKFLALVDHLASIVCPSVNFFSLSLLLQDHWLNVFQNLLRYSPSGLVLSARKWLRYVDKCGCRQPSIFTVISSPLKEFSQNHAHEFLSMSRCVPPKTIPVGNKYGQTAARFNAWSIVFIHLNFSKTKQIPLISKPHFWICISLFQTDMFHLEFMISAMTLILI